MKELYSSDEDCSLLAREIYKKLWEKIEFYGSTYTGIPNGVWLSPYRRKCGETLRGFACIPFGFKFLDGEFLRVTVEDGAMIPPSFGEKVAALSDLYEAIRDMFGEPDFYYSTVTESGKKAMSLEWAFKNRTEEIKSFTEGTPFDDAKVVDFILVGEDSLGGCELQGKTKMLLSREIGLPVGLIPLADKDIENYYLHKKGKALSLPDEKPLGLVREKKED